MVTVVNVLRRALTFIYSYKNNMSMPIPLKFGDMRSSEIRLRKVKLSLRDKRFVNHKAPCTAIWQQPLQSVLALRGCSATDLI